MTKDPRYFTSEPLLALSHAVENSGKDAEGKRQGEKHGPGHADREPEYMGLNRGGILHNDNDGNNARYNRTNVFCVFHIQAPCHDFCALVLVILVKGYTICLFSWISAFRLVMPLRGITIIDVDTLYSIGRADRVSITNG